MKLSDEIPVRRLIPSRIRTLMLANIVVALALALFLNFKQQMLAAAYLLVNVAQVIFALTMIGMLVTVPLVLVESYLYRKKKGVWFQWTAGPARTPRDIIPRHIVRPYRRTSEAETAEKTRVQTRLFESSSASEPVSRPALLLTVGDKLAADGKREAALRCYRQIIERFGGSDEARDAAQRLKSPAPSRPPHVEAGS